MLKQEGVEEEKITVVTLVTCPEAADKFCQVGLKSGSLAERQDLMRILHTDVWCCAPCDGFFRCES